MKLSAIFFPSQRQAVSGRYLLFLEMLFIDAKWESNWKFVSRLKAFSALFKSKNENLIMWSNDTRGFVMQRQHYAL